MRLRPPARPFFLVAALLFAAVITGCGKKTPLALGPFEPPAPPRNLSVIQRQEVLTLSWDHPDRKVEGFIVEKMAAGRFVKLAQTAEMSYSEKVDMDEVHTYRVRAVSTAGVAGEPAGITVRAVAPPAAPAALSFKTDGDDLIFSWESGPEGVMFDICRMERDGQCRRLNTQPFKENAYKVLAEPYKTLTYRVTAVRVEEFVVEGGSADVTIGPKDFVPAKPSRPALVPVDKGLMLLWDENPESWVKEYKIYKSAAGVTEMVGTSAIPSFRYEGKREGAYFVSAVGPLYEGPLSDPAEYR